MFIRSLVSMATHCDVAKRASETKEHMQEIV